MVEILIDDELIENPPLAYTNDLNLIQSESFIFGRCNGKRTINSYMPIFKTTNSSSIA